MNIGLFVFVTERSLDPAVLAMRAEELGFESFWVPEHTIMPVHTSSRFRGSSNELIPDDYSRIVDPFVALARAAAATRRIKLGTGVCLVPERNPLLLAKEVATLDQHSGGRFIFGIGAGWLKEETEIMGGDFPHRWRQTREAILAMKELWTKLESEFHGEYYDFPPVRSFPKPVQAPHPPVLLGSTDKNVFRRVVEWGDGWMPTRVSVEDVLRGRAILDDLAEKAGRDPRSIEVTAFGQPGDFRDRSDIRQLEESGVNRVTFWFKSEGDGDLEAIEEVARQVL